MERVAAGYRFRVGIIVCLIMMDIVINGIADYTSSKENDNILPYIFASTQVGIQVINLVLIFMLFSGTYLFQVGLLNIQLREFKWHLVGVLLYLVIFICYVSIKLVSKEGRALLFSPPPQ